MPSYRWSPEKAVLIWGFLSVFQINTDALKICKLVLFLAYIYSTSLSNYKKSSAYSTLEGMILVLGSTVSLITFMATWQGRKQTVVPQNVPNRGVPKLLGHISTSLCPTYLAVMVKKEYFIKVICCSLEYQDFIFKRMN